METNLTVEDLQNFELKVKDAFENKLIKAPIHLSDGNENQLIEIFKLVGKDDWVLSTWRSHYHCLLKGVPENEVYEEILKGHSISLCFKEHKVFSSAIVGGIIPIAVGLGWALKKGPAPSTPLAGKNIVWAFVGDMAAKTGTFMESYNYVCNFDLPVVFVIEDNDKSVCTQTSKVWNTYAPIDYGIVNEDSHLIRYNYTSKYPHAGGGTRVNF